MNVTGITCVVKQHDYCYFVEYLISLGVSIRIYPYIIQKGEKILVAQKLLDLNYHDASFVGLINTEQLTAPHIDEYFINFKQQYKDLNVQIFDYSVSNIKLFRLKYDIDATLLAYQQTEEINTLKNLLLTTEKRYDLAFVVPIDVPRRNHIYHELINKDISINVICGWGLNRDTQIAQCKALLNIHYNEHYQIFEEIRCNRWLMADMIVFSETSYDNNHIKHYANLKIYNYDDIVDNIVKYIKDKN